MANSDRLFGVAFEHALHIDAREVDLVRVN